MNFKLWLEMQQDRYSWLDPSGRFHPIPNGSSHSTFAANFLRGKIEDRLLFQSLAILMKKGWLRITFYNSELMANNDQTKTFNELQKGALIACAMENQMTKVEFDYGDDTKLIWPLNGDFDSKPSF